MSIAATAAAADSGRGRYKASYVQSERYLLACMRYVELNPVRANMVKAPGEYRWSSYRANALGAEDKLLTPHDQSYSPPMARGNRNDEKGPRNDEKAK